MEEPFVFKCFIINLWPRPYPHFGLGVADLLVRSETRRGPINLAYPQSWNLAFKLNGRSICSQIYIIIIAEFVFIIENTINLYKTSLSVTRSHYHKYAS